MRRALELGYPCPGLAYNYLACIAKARGDLDGDDGPLHDGGEDRPAALRAHPERQRARARGFGKGGRGKGLPLTLTVRHDFQLLERTVQPTLPGPLADDFATWEPPPRRRMPRRGLRAHARRRGEPVVAQDSPQSGLELKGKRVVSEDGKPSRQRTFDSVDRSDGRAGTRRDRGCG